MREIFIPGIYIAEDVSTDTVSPITTHVNGWPYTAAERLATGPGPVDHVLNGFPFNADGRLVSSEGEAVIFHNGRGYTADGSIVIGDAEGVGMIYNAVKYIYNAEPLYYD